MRAIVCHRRCMPWDSKFNTAFPSILWARDVINVLGVRRVLFSRDATKRERFMRRGNGDTALFSPKGLAGYRASRSRNEPNREEVRCMLSIMIEQNIPIVDD